MTTKKMEARKDAIRRAMGVKGPKHNITIFDETTSKPALVMPKGTLKEKPTRMPRTATEQVAIEESNNPESRASRQIVLFADSAADKDLIRKTAAAKGISMNRYILDMVMETIRDN